MRNNPQNQCTKYRNNVSGPLIRTNELYAEIKAADFDIIYVFRGLF